MDTKVDLVAPKATVMEKQITLVLAQKEAFYLRAICASSVMNVKAISTETSIPLAEIQTFWDSLNATLSTLGV